MSASLDSFNFGQKLYDSLPEVYRENDINVNYALKRYLQGLSDGGYAYVIDEANGILKLVDPSKVDMKWIDLLFLQYGLEIFNGIPELYLRNLLKAISNLYSRKGSIASVEYLTSVIAGVVVHVDYSEYETEGIIRIVLEMDYEAEGREGMPRIDQLSRILKEFLPFYIDADIIYSYIFRDNLNLHIVDDVDEDNIISIFNEEIPLSLTHDLSLLNKRTSHITDNFILTDMGVDRSPLSRDYTVDSTSESASTEGSMSLNDDYLYDKIYVNGTLTNEIDYSD